MNFYPETLRAVVAYAEGLNAADKKVAEIGADGVPYMDKVHLLDSDGTDYGWLVDEVGGSWSWVPPEVPKP